MNIYVSTISDENAIMELLNNIGYSTIHGADIERDYKNPLYEDILVESLHRINPNLPESTIQDALQISVVSSITQSMICLFQRMSILQIKNNYVQKRVY